MFYLLSYRGSELESLAEYLKQPHAILSGACIATTNYITREWKSTKYHEEKLHTCKVLPEWYRYVPFTIGKVNKGLATQKIWHSSTKLLIISFAEYFSFFLCFLVWPLLPPHFKCRGLQLHLITWHWHTPYSVGFLWTRIGRHR